MQVLIVSPTDDCIAAEALRTERIPFQLVVPEDDYGYGRMLHHMWGLREPFINLEHDIVPWPGAINKLMACKDAWWCIHEYPVGHSGILQKALGCAKFSKGIIQRFPDANLGWDETAWNIGGMDNIVYGALQVDRGVAPHVHHPPVAHIKARA